MNTKLLALAALAASVALATLSASQASAHQPLEVRIVEPTQGQHVETPVKITFRAVSVIGTEQASTVLNITVDGKHYDPFAGRLQANPPNFGGMPLQSDESRTIKISLPRGSHLMVVTFAPHQGETGQIELRRSFTVTSERRAGLPGLSPVAFAAAGLAVVAIVVTVLFAGRRRKADEDAEPPPVP